MTNFRKLLALSMAVTLCLFLGVAPARAESITQDGLKVTLSTDQDAYDTGDPIQSELMVTNTNASAVENVSLIQLVPDGYELADAYEAESETVSLEPGESLTLSSVYNPTVEINGEDNKEDDNGSGETRNTAGETGNTTGGNTTGGKGSNSGGTTGRTTGKTSGTVSNTAASGKVTASIAKTGDNTNVVLWVVLFGAALTGIIVLIRMKKKNRSRLLSMLLCIVLGGSTLNVTDLRAEEVPSGKTVRITETVSVGDTSVELHGEVAYDPITDDPGTEDEAPVDTDGDGLPDYLEEAFGTDPENPDTDGDGLSDYTECIEIISDPLNPDSDDNGIPDGEEDADADGLTNIREVELGTDLSDADTDADGLTDAEEADVYDTNPVAADTDGDGLVDGDEIILGLDPMNPVSDGSTPDAERTIQQELDSDRVDEALLEDNLLIPSVDGAVPGNLNRNVSIEEDPVYVLENNRAAVGKQVLVKTSYPEGTDLHLNFAYEEGDKRSGFYIIVRYEDGEFVPCKTTQEEGYIWTEAAEGTYFVFDAEKLLIDLDIPIRNYETMGLSDSDADDTVSMDITALSVGSDNEVSDEWYNENYVILDENGMQSELSEYNSSAEGMKSSADEESSDETAEAETAGSDDTEIFTAETAGEAMESFVETEESLSEAEGTDGFDGVEESAAAETVDPAETEEPVQAAEQEATVSEPAETAADANIVETILEDGGQLILRSYFDSGDAPASSSPIITGHEVSGQADIVFVIDTTGSMSGAINNVVRNIESFVDTLETEYSVKANFALVDYKDITCDEETLLVKNGSTAWYSDVSAFKSKVSSLVVTGGGDTPETPIDGLGMARNLDWRTNANKFIILVTDAGYKTDNVYGYESMEEMAAELADSEIITSVISDTGYQSSYKTLYETTDGVFGNIYADFHTVLLSLADKIGEIVNDGSWVLLDDYQIIKLNQPYDAESDYSSDSDSLSDAAELGDVTVSNVKPYIDWVLKNYKVPEGMYDDPTTVDVFKYKSNPILEDTDYDGVQDNREFNEKNRRNPTAKGKMLGYYDVAEAEYTLDYRAFFDSATKYSSKLASASLIFANTIYSDTGFHYTDAPDSDITMIQSMMLQHGFNSIVDYSIGSGSDKLGLSPIHDDDLSEVAIGYHTVTYKNKTKTILGVVVRGTNGTLEEWSSNFDIGNPDTWTSAEHRGFKVAESRIKQAVDQYVSTYLSGTGNIVYWVTGHSRGAAIANILSAELIDEGKSVFGYTYATPATTTSSSRSDARYNSIFNFTNTSDIVTCVPITQWNFGRYGKTFGMTMEVDLESGTEWSRQTSQGLYNALKPSHINTLTQLVAKYCAATREEVYEPSGAQNITSEQYDMISKRALKYCTAEKRAVFSGYKLKPTPAFFFQLGAEIYKGNDTEKSNALELISDFLMEFRNASAIITITIRLFAGNDKAIHDLKNLIKNADLSYVGDGHAPATYYVLMQYL